MIRADRRRRLAVVAAIALWALDVAHPTVSLTAAALPTEDVSGRLEYTCDQSGNPLLDNNPQELFGVIGPCVIGAWKTSQGRPDVTIAVLDSGINWPDKLPDLRRKIRMNLGELPMPSGASTYDADDNGVFNIDDYAKDARVKDRNTNDVLDPEDLILDPVFANGEDDDGNGYIDDIAGWDFFEDDNDPRDEPKYGHGTGEAEDSTGEPNNGGEVGICPRCMFVPLRVGDSFVADVQHFAEAVVYATDNDVDVVQEALGTLNHTRFGQEAIDYAYARGVLTVASAADEEAGHHNWPAAYNHTMVVNAIKGPDLPTRQPPSNLDLVGCTNFGGYIYVAIPGESCSSEATGRSAGMAGLLMSVAKDERARGDLANYPGNDFPLSANEMKQLFRVTADDIDFSSPGLPTPEHPLAVAPPNNYAVADAVPTERYHSVPGWDQFFGYGRVNAKALVERLAATTQAKPTVPPEAQIDSPRWWKIVSARAPVAITGRVAAVRAKSYTYRVQWAAGVQPPEFPATDVWHDVAVTRPGAQSRSFAGTLATIDTSRVRAAIDAGEGWQPNAVSDPTSKSLPERDAFRVRVVVTDSFGNRGEDQKQLFVHDDPALLHGFPIDLESDGTSAPALVDLDDDGAQELVIGDGNGDVHAFRSDGREAKGWPKHTDPGPAMRHAKESPGLASKEITKPIRGSILGGAPLVADLDRDGDVEVVVADLEGKVYAWEHTGELRDGFPASVDRRFSQESSEGEIRNRYNRRDWGINASPSAGDLDGDDGGRLELVFGSNDSHVYAINDDGTTVPGWPVLLRDPAKVASVDPTTHKLTFNADSGHAIGTKILPTPSLGDVDGDGDLEVVAGVNEEYVEDPNFSFNNASLSLIAQTGLVDQGNSRLYVLDRRGTRTPQSVDRYPKFPDEQAYLPGWPFKAAILTTDLLPYVGTGINGSPPLADLDGDRDVEIGVFPYAGPAYILDHTGVSIYGKDPNGHDIALQSERPFYGALANGTDSPTFAALGTGIFTKLDGENINFAAPAGGLIRLVDILLSGHQLGGQDYINAWDLRLPGGTFLLGFPHEVNDLSFFTGPASADIDGDGLLELVGGTAMYDAYGVNAFGIEADGWPRFTGGWNVATPSVGDLDGDGRRDVAMATREGDLFVWKTSASRCGAADWPKLTHDLRNTSNYAVDATRPSAITDLQRVGGVLTWSAPGDDERCGRVARYGIKTSDRPIRTHADWLAATTVGPAPEPQPAGRKQFAAVSGLKKYVSVRSIDDAGNISPVSR